jgi:hypothetical protein
MSQSLICADENDVVDGAGVMERLSPFQLRHLSLHWWHPDLSPKGS